jgi:nitroimidazol reductase NimA-like FMN-containing flavoprotein (pyridoxamine 5'-phosphate oxidase superfamily)
MLIQELTQEDNVRLLSQMHLGRLGCAQGAQPYVVPISFAYNNLYLYSFATAGQKINWMRANPLVCLQADQVMSDDEWVSLVILGRYDELPDTLEHKRDRELAFQLLQQRANWWEAGYAKTIVQHAERKMEPVYFRIQITQISGLHGASELTTGMALGRLPAEKADAKHISEMMASLRKKMFSA